MIANRGKTHEHPETAVERVYEQLKTMTISFQFPPESRINELALSRRIGVSRTPLREALNRLAAEGFLRFSAQLGFFQKPLTVQTTADLYELREQIERSAVRLLIERASEAALDELDALVAGQSDLAGADARAVVEADERLHKALAERTGNAELVDLLNKVNERMRFVRWIDMDGCGTDSQAQHRAILDAVRRRDAAAAERLMIDHVTPSREQIVATVKEAFARIYADPDQIFPMPV
jgi:DNA-binding GntR family transcriptional regulator